MVTMSAVVHDAVPRRLAGTVADHALGRRQPGWWPMLWFIGKVLLLVFVFVWLRGTLPRLRYDQFMRLGWKVLLPVNLVWILVLAGLRGRSDETGHPRAWLIIGGVVVGVLLIAAVLAGQPQAAADADVAGAGRRPADGQLPAAADGSAGTAEPAGHARGRRAGAGQHRCRLRDSDREV